MGILFNRGTVLWNTVMFRIFDTKLKRLSFEEKTPVLLSLYTFTEGGSAPWGTSTQGDVVGAGHAGSARHLDR